MTTLRDASPEDDTFLRKVYACTRAQEMALVPWSEEQREAFLRFQFDAQDSHYRAKFPDASYQIILSEDQPVGRLYVSREADEIRILDITVLPEHRAQGIGTSLLRRLLSEADESRRRVTVWIEQFNPSQVTFQHLGFKISQDDGYNNLLEYQPADPGGPSSPA